MTPVHIGTKIFQRCC